MVELTALRAQGNRRLERDRRARQQPVDDVAVAGFGRHPPGRGVRVGEQTVLLEQRELVADRRRRAAEVRVSGERLRRDRLPGRDIALDDLQENRLLAGREAAGAAAGAAFGGVLAGAWGGVGHPPIVRDAGAPPLLEARRAPTARGPLVRRR